MGAHRLNGHEIVALVQGQPNIKRTKLGAALVVDQRWVDSFWRGWDNGVGGRALIRSAAEPRRGIVSSTEIESRSAVDARVRRHRCYVGVVGMEGMRVHPGRQAHNEAEDRAHATNRRVKSRARGDASISVHHDDQGSAMSPDSAR